MDKGREHRGLKIILVLLFCAVGFEFDQSEKPKGGMVERGGAGEELVHVLFGTKSDAMQREGENRGS